MAYYRCQSCNMVYEKYYPPDEGTSLPEISVQVNKAVSRYTRGLNLFQQHFLCGIRIHPYQTKKSHTTEREIGGGLMATDFIGWCNSYFDRKSKNTILVIGILGSLVVGILDITTPPQYLFYFLYLFPICFTTWCSDVLRAGLVALVCMVFFSTSQFQLTHDYYASIWNIVSTVATFVTIIWMVHWINLRWKLEAELSRVDPLTGAFNYRGFLELVALEVSLLQRLSEPFSLAYLDIDNFKKVNDTYGHKAGDQLLQSVVQDIREHLRKTNIIGRIGGDEFTLFMPGTDKKAAQVVIEKLKKTLIETFRLDGLSVTLSIGVVSCAEGKCDLEGMITQADDLMYEVKHSGKDNVRYGEYQPVD